MDSKYMDTKVIWKHESNMDTKNYLFYYISYVDRVYKAFSEY